MTTTSTQGAFVPACRRTYIRRRSGSAPLV